MDFSPARTKLPANLPSLTQLLASHGRILVLDAASSTVHAGLCAADRPAAWRKTAGDAGESLFADVDGLLRTAGVGLADVAAFVFCEGPGSMLGIRTVAMAVRTWQAEIPRPAYRYQSLALVAHDLLRRGESAPFTVIADARRETWHAVAVGSGPGPLRRVPTGALAAGTEPLWQPSAFRAWAAAPRPARDCSYDVPALLAAHADVDLFAPTEEPDAFQHEAPEYRKWSAQVHSADSVPPR